jgi:hypothetical protein
VAVPPLKLVAKVRDHFGIEICDSGKNKWALGGRVLWF